MTFIIYVIGSYINKDVKTVLRNKREELAKSTVSGVKSCTVATAICALGILSKQSTAISSGGRDRRPIASAKTSKATTNPARIEHLC